MLTAIAIFIIAVSNSIAVYYISKRSDKLQEQINDLEMKIHNNSVESERTEDFQRAINDNLEKNIKSQYSHFTSRMDKLKNDVLQNNKTY